KVLRWRSCRTARHGNGHFKISAKIIVTTRLTKKPCRTASNTTACCSRMITAMRGQSSLCSSFGKTLWKAYQGRLVPSLMLFAKFFRASNNARPNGRLRSRYGRSRRVRREGRSMGSKRVAGEPSDVCHAKQGFPDRFERFPGELSLGPRNILLEWLCADSQHANDAPSTPLQQLGRIFSHAQQSHSKRSAPKIPQSRACAQD